MTDPYVIDKTKIEYCPQCMANNRGHVRMEFHHAWIFHAIYDIHSEVGIWACDEKWKCPKCRYVGMYGNPITKACYEATLDAWGGNYEWWREPNKMAERLVALGYLDVREKGIGIKVELAEWQEPKRVYVKLEKK